MGTPLKTPPVYLTLAQVRFNPILKLTDFLPSIQESFRQAGYPDFDRQQTISIQITLQDGQAPTPTPVQVEKYMLGNAEKTHTFFLDSQSLTIQTTNYPQSETFLECFLKGLTIVDEAVKLAYTERIGLRYLDRVMPKNGETIDQYLVEPVRGLKSRLGGQSLHSFTEALNQIGDIKLLSRVAIQTGAIAFPPDIQHGNLKIPERFIAYIGESAILDNDGFVESRENFSITTVGQHLTAIQKVTSAAFKTTVTPYALSVWDN